MRFHRIAGVGNVAAGFIRDGIPATVFANVHVACFAIRKSCPLFFRRAYRNLVRDMQTIGEVRHVQAVFLGTRRTRVDSRRGIRRYARRRPECIGARVAVGGKHGDSPGFVIPVSVGALELLARSAVKRLGVYGSVASDNAVDIGDMAAYGYRTRAFAFSATRCRIAIA